jgi:hypothetical protein
MFIQYNTKIKDINVINLILIMSSLFMLKTLLNAGLSENKDKILTFVKFLGQSLY